MRWLLFVLFFPLQSVGAPFCSQIYSISLAESFAPYQSRSQPVPPWRYSRELLSEPIPSEIQEQLNQRFRLIDQANSSYKYLQLVKQFRQNPDLFKRWSDWRSRLARAEFYEAGISGETYLQSDLLLYKWVIESKEMDITALQEVHQKLMESNTPEYDKWGRTKQLKPGQIREKELMAQDKEHLYPRADEVPLALHDFFGWYSENKDIMHPVQLAALSYRWLVSIQPFLNGNKRVARFIADWILVKNGYPVLIGMIPGDILPGNIYGKISYAENMRSWELIKKFSMLLQFSVKKMNEELAANPD